MERSDADLVRRAQRGDDEAFEVLLVRHFEAAFAVALGVAADRDEAEDVLQDAFVRAWERIGQCRRPERFRGWLASVVRSTGLNRVEARKRRRQTSLGDMGLKAETPSPSTRVERSELRARLEAALEKLPEVQRQAVLLYDLEGWSHAEVAELLDISVLMSRRHVSDGRRALRAILDPGRTEEEST